MSPMCPARTANPGCRGPRLCSSVWSMKSPGFWQHQGWTRCSRTCCRAKHTRLCKQPHANPCCHHQAGLTVSLCSPGGTSILILDQSHTPCQASCPSSSFFSPPESFHLLGTLSSGTSALVCDRAFPLEICPCIPQHLPVENVHAHFDIFSNNTADKYGQGEA